MIWVADSGVLIRYVQPRDPEFALVRASVGTLRKRGDAIAFVTQNSAEYWSVTTRPSSARGGYGLSPQQADWRLRLLERTFLRLQDRDAAYDIWRHLLTAYAISGVQAHDARLVASLLAHHVTHLLTFNTSDFARYSEITAVHPMAL